MRAHIPFPKIATKPRYTDPRVPYQAFVKLHGTNAAIKYTPDMPLTFQSRNRIITPEHDNLGFAAAHAGMTLNLGHDSLVIYGEWVGPDIQNGVGISKLPERKFYPFAVKNLRKMEFVKDPAEDLHLPFPLDLLDPYHVFAPGGFSGLEEMVAEIDACCPVAGSGHGEGLVLRPFGENEWNFDFWFKAKGASHQKGAKTKVRVPKAHIDGSWFVEQITKRHSQGLEYLREMEIPIDRSATAHFIKWVLADIEAEEELPEGLEIKMGGKYAAPIFLENL